MNNGKSFWTPGRVVAAAITVIGLAVMVPTCEGVIEVVDAGEIVIRQSVFSGNLTYWRDPGPKMQWWGKCTHYRKSVQFWFSSSKDQGKAEDQSIKLRFNDGGHGTLSGSIRYTLPLDELSLKSIHEKYGSQEAIDQSLIRTVMEKVVYLSGSLMSSTESYAAKRNMLIEYIEDQAAWGVYKSSAHCEKQLDPVSKQEKTVCLTEIEKDSKGMPLRVEPSPVRVANLTLSNLSINDLSYDQEIQSQIKAQQAAIAAVKTAEAEARKAEQNVITVAKQGEANAAKAKWEQEVVKAKEVTQAEQEKEVAKLDKEAAEFTKQKEILLGEGEASRKKLAMQANGALEQKLASWVEVNKSYAEALKQQRVVPEIYMGSGSGNMPNASAFMDLLTATTAHQIGLSLTPTAQGKK